MPRRRYAVILGLIVLVGLGVRLGFVAAESDQATKVGDSNFYFGVARQLVDGDGFIRPFEFEVAGARIETAEHPPLFPVVLAIPAALGLRSAAAAAIFCSFIGAATLLLIAALGRKVGGDAVGLVAAGLAAVYPVLWQPNGLLLSETLYIPIVTGLLLLAYAIRERATTLRWFGFGVLVGLAALTRGEGFAFLFVLGVPLVWCTASTMRARLKPAVIMCVSAIVIVAPWTIRNARTFDRFIPVSNNLSIAVSGANCDSVYHGTDLGSFDPVCYLDDFTRAREHVASGDEAAVLERVGKVGRTYMLDHLDRLPAVVTARVLRTWGFWPPSPILDYDVVDYGLRGPLAVGQAMFLLMFAFAIGGVVVLRRRRTLLWPLLVPGIIVVVVSAALHGLTRFRAAVEVPVIVLAAVALVAIASHLRARSADHPAELLEPSVSH